MCTAYEPQPLQQFGFKHIGAKRAAGETAKEFSTSAGRTRSGSCAQTPIRPQLPTLENDTYASQELLESNEYLRARLRNAESSASFLTQRLRELEKNERKHESQLKERELLLSEAKEQLATVTAKYRKLKKMLPQLEALREKCALHEYHIAELHSQKQRLDGLCEKYCEELQQLQHDGSTTNRVLGENSELHGLVEQMRPELKRLADVLEATNFKLQKFEQEKKQLTKELMLTRMEKESMMRLFDKCKDQTDGNRQIVLVEAYNELVIRWAQILEENEEIKLERVHLVEELGKLGWTGSQLTAKPSRKDLRVVVPPLNFPPAKITTPSNQASIVSQQCYDRADLKIIDSEESCELLVTPGTVKRIGVIRSSSGKKPRS